MNFCKIQKRRTFSLWLACFPTPQMPLQMSRALPPGSSLPLNSNSAFWPTLPSSSVNPCWSPPKRLLFFVLKWMYYPRQVSSLLVYYSRNSVFTIQGPSLLNYSDFMVCISLSSIFCSCWWQTAQFCATLKSWRYHSPCVAFRWQMHSANALGKMPSPKCRCLWMLLPTEL